jgi:hypothetical protein
MTRPLSLLLAGLALLGAVACGFGVFATVAAAPCDPSAPVLSDGTREAPGAWAAGWLALMFASAACLGAGVVLTLGLRLAGSKPLVIGGITGGVALLVLWIVGATYWANQCPA